MCTGVMGEPAQSWRSRSVQSQSQLGCQWQLTDRDEVSDFHPMITFKLGFDGASGKRMVLANPNKQFRMLNMSLSSNGNSHKIEAATAARPTMFVRAAAGVSY